MDLRVVSKGRPLNKNGPVTLEDISKKASVSINTVAKVLSGQQKKARIADRTANRIRKIAKELDYSPNLMARNLRAQRSGVIGIHIAEMSDPIDATNAQNILRTLNQLSYFPLLTVAEEGLEFCRQSWWRNRVEGIILCGTSQEMDTTFFADLQKRSVVAVIAGSSRIDPNLPFPQTPPVSLVAVDNQMGIQLTINHLRNQDRVRIAFIAGPSWQSDAYERKHAYESLIRQYHPPYIVESVTDDSLFKQGFEGTQSLMESDKDIDAIIAYDDSVALGAMKWLTDHKYRVPQDIAIVGFDNSPQAEYLTPSLTSIAQPTETIAKKSVDILVNALLKKSMVEQIKVAPTLVVRDSTQT